MENSRKTKKYILISLLILCSLFGIYKVWTIIPDYSAQQTSASSNCPEPVRDICRVSQDSAFNLYSSFQEKPESLDEIEQKKLADILTLLKSYGITQENDIEYLLAVAKGMGCGFSILAEVIIDLYQDKPDLFKEEYGYPLYYEQDGEIFYNTETLFMDIFARIKKAKLKDINHTVSNEVFILTYFGYDMHRTSIPFVDMPRYLSAVINDNTETAVFQRDISSKKYKEYMDRKDFDYACIALFDFVLSPYGSNPCEGNHTSIDSGHWMRITDITKDGHYIVSSWGEEWEILEGNPHFKNKTYAGIYQPLSDVDGGLIFLKVND